MSLALLAICFTLVSFLAYCLTLKMEASTACYMLHVGIFLGLFF
jgi:hypothetical protein